MEKAKTEFEKDLERIEAIAEEIESGKTGFEKGIELFREGSELIRKCRKHLEDAELVVQKAIKDESDSVTLEDFSE